MGKDMSYTRPPKRLVILRYLRNRMEYATPMKLFSVAFLLLICSACSPLRSQLSIEFDLSNTRKTLHILNSTSPSEASLRELVELPSSQALLRKLGTTDGVMIQALKKSFDPNAKTTKEEDNFQYRAIRDDLGELSAFVDTLQLNGKALEERLQQALAPYLPPHETVAITIVGITGGHSTGYTFGDKDTFYLSLHHMNHDMDYVHLICKHELFHNLQALWYDHETPVNVLENQQETSPDFGTYYLLLSLYSEGTATYLDAIEQLTPTEANRIWTEGHEKNKDREAYIFWLFDQTLVQLQRDFSNRSLNRAYGTFFTTTYDQQGYYIGALITAYLLEKQPEKTLQDYMIQNPLHLISDYLRISREDPDAPYQFSDEFGAIVDRLRTTVDALPKN